MLVVMAVSIRRNRSFKIFDVSYDGMPVIIYGHIYDDAPGEFDKPVDYGEEV